MPIETSNQLAADASFSAQGSRDGKVSCRGKRKVSQGERVLRVVHALQTKKELNARKLAKLTGASRRTIFRDLNLLSRNGIEFLFDKSTRKYKPGKDQLPFDRFTCEEIDTLMLSLEFAVQGRMVLHGEAALSVKDKLLAIMPEGIQRRWRLLERKIQIRLEAGTDAGEVGPVFQAIQFCLMHRKKTDLRCESNGSAERFRLISPLCLGYFKNAWQVLVSFGGIADMEVIPLRDIVESIPSSEAALELPADAEIN